MKSVAVLLMLALGGCGGPDPTSATPLLTTEQALASPQPPADHRIPYGPGPVRFGDLWLPERPGPHAVVVLLHGGCWLADYDLGYVSAFAAALAERGLAVWSLEYRRVGDEGGGWPGTFIDVAAGIDHLRTVAESHPLDLTRVALVGHSAGGHLALWAAARRGLAPTDPIRGGDPLPVLGVVSLAGIPDLAAYASDDGCGASIPELIGGHPAEVPDRLTRTSPVAMVPMGTLQIVVAGHRDSVVPATHAEEHVRRAQATGDPARLVIIEEAGHFELTTPNSIAWPVVVEAVESLFD